MKCATSITLSRGRRALCAVTIAAHMPVQPGALSGRARLWALPLACVALLAGCVRQPVSNESDQGFTKTFGSDPVRVVLSLDRQQFTIADSIRATVEVIMQEDYEAELPEYPRDPGVPSADSSEQPKQLTCRAFDDKPPSFFDDGRLVQARVYQLDPFLPGEYVVAPLKVQYWRRGEESSRSELVTEPVPVQVKSVLGNESGPASIGEIVPPVPLRRHLWPYIAGLAVSLSLVGAVVFLWLRRRKSKVMQPVIVPPHLRALQQLEALQGERLIEKGLSKEFYVRVSGILRHYLDERFALRAPERTTEEFLNELRDDPRLDTRQRLLLRDFLSHCDLVKFARHEPCESEIRGTFDTCRQFILDMERTHLEAASVQSAS